MDDGFQQKKNRLDSLSSKIARGSARASATRDEPRKCKGCAAELAPGVAPGDSCSNCSTAGASSQRRPLCAVCGLSVPATANYLDCGLCGKSVHADCDRALDADPDEYACAACRASPLVGTDAMLGGDSPLQDAEASNQGGQSSLLGGSSRAGSIGGESAGGRYSHQRERRISAGSSESSSYSARNSPSFDPNACSEDDEEFRPGRGGFASRGGRGGKKKPGGRGGTLMKTRSGGKPASGVFLDRLGKTERGKRGKGRGAGKGPSSSGKGGGAGTRGRRASSSMRGALGMPAAMPFLTTASPATLAALQQQMISMQAAANAKAVAAAAAAAAAPPAAGGAAAAAAAAAATAASETAALLSKLHAVTEANAAVAAAAFPTTAAAAAAAAAASSSSSSSALAAAAAASTAGGGVGSNAAAAAAAAAQQRGEKEDEYVRTIVIAPEDDGYVSVSPLCLVCGSIGRGAEQSMVACSGCAHTFHTYCVGLHEKMNATIVNRGWRCLDCTICESCGLNKDDSRLIMCEECDVAYHMYCLNPPLERAPAGPWRCQWCAKCRRCQMRCSNSELTKEGLCHPCLSLRKCPKCTKLYQLHDAIIRCSQCMKWCHGACEDLHTDEMLESAALNKMRCSSCRPNANKTSCYASANDGSLILCDNVALNKCADEVLKSRMMPSLFRANSFSEGAGAGSVLGGLLGEYGRSTGSIDSHFGGSMDDDSANGPEEDALAPLVTFGPGSRGGRGGGRGGGAGRGRVLKLGVGGFFVKLPKHKLLAAEEEEREAMNADPNDPTKKVKRQRKPRRSQLEDAYPSNIQEGFFGTRAVDGKSLAEVEVAEPVLEEYKTARTIKDRLAGGDTLSTEASEALRDHMNEADMLDNMNLNDIMNIGEDALDFDLFGDDDDDIFGLEDALDFMQKDTEESSQPKPEPDEAGGAAGGGAMQQQPGGSSQQQPQQAQPLLHGQQHPMQQMMAMQPPPGGIMIKQEPGVMPQQMMQQQHAHHQHMQHMQQQQHLHQQQQHHHQQHPGMGPGGMMIKQEPGMMRSDSAMSGGSMMSGGGGGAASAAAAAAAHHGQLLQERQNATAAATERWEEDEPLGDKATKAAVLYVNMMHPDARARFPDWSERAKYIHRVWRGLSAEERQLYVQRARFNRAQREKVPRPRIPRNPQLGGPGGSGPSGSGGGGLTTGQVAMRLAAGAGALPGTAPGAAGGSGGGGPLGGYGGLGGAVRGPMPGMPPQPPSLEHLPPELQREYVAMRKRNEELNQRQELHEKELGALRTTKKKLNAKQRQIKKVAEAAALTAAVAAANAAGHPPPTTVPPTDADLNESDKETLARALDALPAKQRECEEAKREYKSHANTMHAFEMQHRILSEYVTAHQQQSGAAGAAGGGQTVGGMLSASMGGRQGMGMGAMGGAYQQMVVPQQVPFGQMMGGERGYQLGGIGGGGGGGFGSRMGSMGRWQPALSRSAVLGGVRYEQLATADERDVYECLDEALGKISFDLDGPPPMMQQQPQQPQQMGGFPGGGPSLKRLLDPTTMSAAAAAAGGGPASMLQGGDEAPKQKKKRVMTKKATSLQGGNDYEACLERMVAALRACPPLPRRALEPTPRNEPAPFAVIGMSDLGDKFERAQHSKVPLGQLKLTFTRDIYEDVRSLPAPPEVSMARLAPNARLALLQQMASSSSSSSSSAHPTQLMMMMPSCTPAVVRDDGDAGTPSTSQCGPPASDVIRALTAGLERRRRLLRCSSKLAECAFPPADPHRVAFKVAKKEEDEEVEIAIEIEERCLPGASAAAAAAAGGEINENGAAPHNNGLCRDEATRLLLQKLQAMLEMKKPIDDYQLDTPPASPPPHSTMGEPGGVVVDMKPPIALLQAQQAQQLQPRCRLCGAASAATQTGVRQSMSLLGLTPTSDDGKDDSVTFCTLKCYYMFVAAAKVALSPDQLERAAGHVDEATHARLRQLSADSFARCINQNSLGRVSIKAELTVGAALAAGLGPASLAAAAAAGGGAPGAAAAAAAAAAVGPPPPQPLAAAGSGTPLPDITSPRDSRFPSLLDDPPPRKENVHSIRCAELAQLADSGRKERARAAGVDWKRYDKELLDTFLRIHATKTELAKASKMGLEFHNSGYDRRTCVLCGGTGDGQGASSVGRLLNYDAAAWVHANCALWSSEVYENASGQLINVDRAVIRGTVSYCKMCGKVGATLQCYKHECKSNFHFGCATRAVSGRFLKDKTYICPNHTDVHLDACASLEPLRRLLIPRDENKLLAKLFEHMDGPRLMLRLGALTFSRLGQLLPEQLKTCHSARYIFPLGYAAQRVFWSPADARRRVRFTLSITEQDGKPLFNVTMPAPPNDLAGLSGHTQSTTPVVWRKPSAAEAWKEVMEGVARVRERNGGFLRLATASAAVEPECLFGLGEASITKMTESLPGVDSLYSYTFRHGGAPILELPLAENPSGCARCEPRLRTLIKSHRRPVPKAAAASASAAGAAGAAGGSGSGSKRHQSLYEELQMCMKASGYRGDFVATGGGKWDQYGSTEQSYSAYQKMRKEWRNTVYLARSKIQGLGLYAKRDIDMGAMIIEYKGEIVRGEVCEMREKRYFAQNRGTYMFKASDECIIDATMKGGPARYVNHSCDPNCATHIMSLGVNGEDKKIIITANRPIKEDEELTYDYQFDIEDDSDKVACLCGAPNCQRWMN